MRVDYHKLSKFATIKGRKWVEIPEAFFGSKLFKFREDKKRAVYKNNAVITQLDKVKGHLVFSDLGSSTTNEILSFDELGDINPDNIDLSKTQLVSLNILQRTDELGNLRLDHIQTPIVTTKDGKSYAYVEKEMLDKINKIPMLLILGGETFPATKKQLDKIKEHLKEGEVKVVSLTNVHFIKNSKEFTRILAKEVENLKGYGSEWVFYHFDNLRRSFYFGRYNSHLKEFRYLTKSISSPAKEKLDDRLIMAKDFTRVNKKDYLYNVSPETEESKMDIVEIVRLTGGGTGNSPISEIYGFERWKPSFIESAPHPIFTRILAKYVAEVRICKK